MPDAARSVMKPGRGSTKQKMTQAGDSGRLKRAPSMYRKDL